MKLSSSFEEEDSKPWKKRGKSRSEHGSRLVLTTER